MLARTAVGGDVDREVGFREVKWVHDGGCGGASEGTCEELKLRLRSKEGTQEGFVVIVEGEFEGLERGDANAVGHIAFEERETAFVSPHADEHVQEFLADV